MKCLGLLAGFIFLFSSCAKDEGGRIQDVPVDFRVTLQEFQIRSKNNILLVDNKGVAGLIIYKKSDGRFTAFDRCSSVNPEKRCAVIPDDPSLTATDPCSGAKFSLFDGLPVKAPGKRPLKQYQVFVSNFDISVIN